MKGWHEPFLRLATWFGPLRRFIVAHPGTLWFERVGDANGYASAADDFNEDGSKGIDIPNYNGIRHEGWSRAEYKAGVFGPQVNTLFTAPTPGPGVEGNAGINRFRGPGYFDLDTGLSKRIQLPWLSGQHSTLQLRAEAINTFNRANLFLSTAIAQGNLNASTYQVGNTNANLGQAQSAGQGRIIQVGGRFEF